MEIEKKKTVRKYPFKKLIVIIETLAFAASALSCTFLGITLKDKNRCDSEYQDKYSFYYDNGFDIMVSGASTDQVTGFDNNTEVSHMSKAANISLNVKVDNNEDYRNILVFDNPAEIEHSEFNSSRVIERKHVAGTSVGVDYKFCQLYDVSLGDQLAITANGSELNVIIDTIYRTDYLYTEGVIVTTQDVLKFTPKSFYVYINSNNVADLKNQLRDYKPMGTLLDKTSFQNDEEYQRYLDEFYAKDYYSTCVIDLSETADAAMSQYADMMGSANKMYIASVIAISVICLATSLICFFVNAKNKKDKIYRYIQENGGKRIMTLFSVFNLSLLLFITCGTLITFGLSLNGLTVFYSFANLISNCYLALLVPSLSVLAGFGVTAIAIKMA